MSEFEDKLNSLLSDPQRMAQIMELAQNFSQPGPQPELPAQPAPAIAEEAADPVGGFDLSALMGQLDPQLLGNLLPLVQDLTRSQSSEREQLLMALRPFLKPERQVNIEKALKLSKLLHLGKLYFLKRREDRDV